MLPATALLNFSTETAFGETVRTIGNRKYAEIPATNQGPMMDLEAAGKSRYLLPALRDSRGRKIAPSRYSKYRHSYYLVPLNARPSRTIARNLLAQWRNAVKSTQNTTQQISTQGYVTQAEYDKLQVDLALAQNKITLLEQKAPGLAIDGYYGNLVAGQPITLGVKVVPSGVQISNFNVGSSDSNIVDVSKDINGNIVLTPRKASLLPVTITVAAGVTEGWLGTSFSVTVQ
jgi:hypothetical protein